MLKFISWLLTLIPWPWKKAEDLAEQKGKLEVINADQKEALDAVQVRQKVDVDTNNMSRDELNKRLQKYPREF